MAKKKQDSILPPVGSIGIEELVPALPKTADNPETIKIHARQLEEANFALNKFNNDMMLKLAEKDKEISHLKELLLGGGVPLIIGEGLVASTPEEQLIQIQIQKIQSSAMVRELTLDEIKKFDLLIKNKNLIQERPTEIPGRAKSSAKSKEELSQIASKRTTEEKS